MGFRMHSRDHFYSILILFDNSFEKVEYTDQSYTFGLFDLTHIKLVM